MFDLIFLMKAGFWAGCGYVRFTSVGGSGHARNACIRSEGDGEHGGKIGPWVRGSVRAAGAERGAENGSFCEKSLLRRPLPPNSQRSVPKNSSRKSKSDVAVKRAVFDRALCDEARPAGECVISRCHLCGLGLRQQGCSVRTSTESGGGAALPAITPLGVDQIECCVVLLFRDHPPKEALWNQSTEANRKIQS